MSFTISTVNALPSTLEPLTIYLVRVGQTDELIVYVTGAEATIAYRTKSLVAQQTDLTNLITSIITGLRDVPDGLAGVGASGLLSTDIGLNGQDTIIVGDTLEYLWQDNVSHFTVRSSSGGNNPTFGNFMGNFQGLLFSASTMNQVWCDYHIKHDYAMGTKVYPHVHWLPTTNQAGTVRWGIEYMVAKGHTQQKFANPTTIYVEQTVQANNLGMHYIAECTEAQAIPATDLEPDSFVKLRVFRDANHANDTYPAEVHAWCCDLHYQFARLGTIHRAPNFFA